jgi:hypothetical protein
MYASPDIVRVIKEDMMVRACSLHGRDEKCIQCFGWKT